MSTLQRTISPVDGSVYVERPHASTQEIDTVLAKATQADRKSTRLNSSHMSESRMPSSA